MKDLMIELLESDLTFIKNSVANDDEDIERLNRIVKISSVLSRQEQNEANRSKDASTLNNERMKLELEEKRLEFEKIKLEREMHLEELKIKIEERKLESELKRLEVDRELQFKKIRTDKLSAVGNIAIAATKVLDTAGTLVTPSIQYKYNTKYANGICRMEMKDAMFTTPGRDFTKIVKLKTGK